MQITRACVGSISREAALAESCATSQKIHAINAQAWNSAGVSALVKLL
jgi:hypothetical protein